MAGNALQGEAIVEISEKIDPTNLILEVIGKEKVFVPGEGKKARLL